MLKVLGVPGVLRVLVLMVPKVPRVLVLMVPKVPRVLVLMVPRVTRVLVPKVLRVLVLGAMGVLLVRGPLLAQAPARDGVITGQVIDALTGKPVSAVLVSLGGASPAPNSPRVSGDTNRILTGSDGRFVFSGLGTGSFTVTASKGGYAEGASGRRRPGGAAQPVVLTAAQRAGDAVVRMWKNGAITGTVTDEAGEPVVGLQVRALARVLATGRRQFAPVGAAATTDDRGVYRFSSLLPGDYLVVASPPGVSAKSTLFADVARTGRATGELAGTFVGLGSASIEVGDAWLALPRGSAVPPQPDGGRLHIYPPTFYPAASSSAQASIVTLVAGDERAAVDIQLLPVPAVRVSGLLLSPSGPADMVAVRLVPTGSDDVPADLLAAGSISDGSGAFAFAGVVPGQYSLRATRSAVSGSEAYWIDMPLAVGGDDIEGLTATMSPPLQISGRVQFDGSTPGPAASRGLGFSLEPIDRTVPFQGNSARWTEQGFTISGYPPGRYRVRVANSPQGWMFKGAMLNGVDVSETPFELTRSIADLTLVFTDRWSGMSGAVQGAGADAASVLVFPTDAGAWTTAGPSSRRFRSARANAGGQFGIGSLPPGDYFVIAVPEEDTMDWRDPAVLETLARAATRIAILEGEHKTIDLPLREVRR